MSYPIEILPRAVLDASLIATNKVPYGDMEFEGVADWGVGNSATLTKEVDAYDGFRCLRAAYNGVTGPHAIASGVLTPAKYYRLTGAARGDGTYYPRIMTGLPTPLWDGTTSTSWQPASVDFLADDTSLLFRSIASSSGFAEFDSIVVREIDGIGGDYVDDYYYVRGWAKGSADAKPRVYDGGTVLWEGAASTAWQFFEVSFLPLTTKIALGSSEPDYPVEFDYMVLRKIADVEESVSTGLLATGPFGAVVMQYDIDSAGNVAMFDNGTTLAGPGSITVRKLDGAGRVASELDTRDEETTQNFFHGNIGEILVYERNLTTAEREALTAFLKTKWGIA